MGRCCGVCMGWRMNIQYACIHTFILLLGRLDIEDKNSFFLLWYTIIRFTLEMFH